MIKISIELLQQNWVHSAITDLVKSQASNKLKKVRHTPKKKFASYTNTHHNKQRQAHAVLR